MRRPGQAHGLSETKERGFEGVGQGRAGLSVSDVSDHSRKTTNQPKKKTEGKEKNVEISSVVLKAAKHCLIFNGGICLFEKLYSKVNDEERNPDIFVILSTDRRFRRDLIVLFF